MSGVRHTRSRRHEAQHVRRRADYRNLEEAGGEHAILSASAPMWRDRDSIVPTCAFQVRGYYDINRSGRAVLVRTRASENRRAGIFREDDHE